MSDNNNHTYLIMMRYKYCVIYILHTLGNPDMWTEQNLREIVMTFRRSVTYEVRFDHNFAAIVAEIGLRTVMTSEFTAIFVYVKLILRVWMFDGRYDNHIITRNDLEDLADKLRFVIVVPPSERRRLVPGFLRENIFQTSLHCGDSRRCSRDEHQLSTSDVDSRPQPLDERILRPCRDYSLPKEENRSFERVRTPPTLGVQSVFPPTPYRLPPVANSEMSHKRLASKRLDTSPDDTPSTSYRARRPVNEQPAKPESERFSFYPVFQKPANLQHFESKPQTSRQQSDTATLHQEKKDIGGKGDTSAMPSSSHSKAPQNVVSPFRPLQKKPKMLDDTTPKKVKPLSGDVYTHKSKRVKSLRSRKTLQLPKQHKETSSSSAFNKTTSSSSEDESKTTGRIVKKNPKKKLYTIHPRYVSPSTSDSEQKALSDSEELSSVEDQGFCTSNLKTGRKLTYRPSQIISETSESDQISYSLEKRSIQRLPTETVHQYTQNLPQTSTPVNILELHRGPTIESTQDSKLSSPSTSKEILKLPVKLEALSAVAVEEATSDKRESLTARQCTPKQRTDTSVKNEQELPSISAAEGPLPGAQSLETMPFSELLTLTSNETSAKRFLKDQQEFPSITVLEEWLKNAPLMSSEVKEEKAQPCTQDLEMYIPKQFRTQKQVSHYSYLRDAVQSSEETIKSEDSSDEPDISSISTPEIIGRAKKISPTLVSEQLQKLLRERKTLCESSSSSVLTADKSNRGETVPSKALTSSENKQEEIPFYPFFKTQTLEQDNSILSTSLSADQIAKPVTTPKKTLSLPIIQKGASDTREHVSLYPTVEQIIQQADESPDPTSASAADVLPSQHHQSARRSVAPPAPPLRRKLSHDTVDFYPIFKTPKEHSTVSSLAGQDISKVHQSTSEMSSILTSRQVLNLPTAPRKRLSMPTLRKTATEEELCKKSPKTDKSLEIDWWNNPDSVDVLKLPSASVNFEELDESSNEAEFKYSSTRKEILTQGSVSSTEMTRSMHSLCTQPSQQHYELSSDTSSDVVPRFQKMTKPLGELLHAEISTTDASDFASSHGIPELPRSCQRSPPTIYPSILEQYYGDPEEVKEACPESWEEYNQEFISTSSNSPPLRLKNQLYKVPSAPEIGIRSLPDKTSCKQISPSISPRNVQSLPPTTDFFPILRTLATFLSYQSCADILIPHDSDLPVEEEVLKLPSSSPRYVSPRSEEIVQGTEQVQCQFTDEQEVISSPALGETKSVECMSQISTQDSVSHYSLCTQPSQEHDYKLSSDTSSDEIPDLVTPKPDSLSIGDSSLQSSPRSTDVPPAFKTVAKSSDEVAKPPDEPLLADTSQPHTSEFSVLGEESESSQMSPQQTTSLPGLAKPHGHGVQFTIDAARIETTCQEPISTMTSSVQHSCHEIKPHKAASVQIFGRAKPSKKSRKGASRLVRYSSLQSLPCSTDFSQAVASPVKSTMQITEEQEKVSVSTSIEQYVSSGSLVSTQGSISSDATTMSLRSVCTQPSQEFKSSSVSKEETNVSSGSFLSTQGSMSSHETTMSLLSVCTQPSQEFKSYLPSNEGTPVSNKSQLSEQGSMFSDASTMSLRSVCTQPSQEFRFSSSSKKGTDVSSGSLVSTQGTISSDETTMSLRSVCTQPSQEFISSAPSDEGTHVSDKSQMSKQELISVDATKISLQSLCTQSSQEFESSTKEGSNVFSGSHMSRQRPVSSTEITSSMHSLCTQPSQAHYDLYPTTSSEEISVIPKSIPHKTVSAPCFAMTAPVTKVKENVSYSLSCTDIDQPPEEIQCRYLYKDEQDLRSSSASEEVKNISSSSQVLMQGSASSNSEKTSIVLTKSRSQELCGVSTEDFERQSVLTTRSISEHSQFENKPHKVTSAPAFGTKIKLDKKSSKAISLPCSRKNSKHSLPRSTDSLPVVKKHVKPSGEHFYADISTPHTRDLPASTKTSELPSSSRKSSRKTKYAQKSETYVELAQSTEDELFLERSQEGDSEFILRRASSQSLPREVHSASNFGISSQLDLSLFSPDINLLQIPFDEPSQKTSDKNEEGAVALPLASCSTEFPSLPYSRTTQQACPAPGVLSPTALRKSFKEVLESLNEHRHTGAAGSGTQRRHSSRRTREGSPVRPQEASQFQVLTHPPDEARMVRQSSEPREAFPGLEGFFRPLSPPVRRGPPTVRPLPTVRTAETQESGRNEDVPDLEDDGIDQTFRNLVDLLSQDGRFGLLQSIADEYKNTEGHTYVFYYNILHIILTSCLDILRNEN